MLKLGETAKLTFRDSQGNVLVEGKNVADSSVVKNKQTGEYEVSLEFDKQGAEDFADATEKLVGQSMGIIWMRNRYPIQWSGKQVKGGQA